MADYKERAIRDIDVALLAEPETKLEELETSFRNFLEQIRNSTSLGQINTIKSNVLANIQRVRESKTHDQDQTTKLANLRAEAINLIHQELKRQPPLSESDISNRNWEADLVAAGTESRIIEIRDSVLVDIQTKRADKKEELEVAELIKQGANVTTFEALGEILSKLKKYVSSNVYQKKSAEISQLETRLQSLDPAKYKQQTKKDLDQQVKNQGLSEKELDEDTKKAKVQAEQTGKPEDKKAAEEKISQNGAKVNLNKLISKAKAVLNNKKSKIEQIQLAKELEAFIKKNKYQSAEYQARKSEVNQLLKQLRGEEVQNHLSQNPKWPKVLGIGALIVIPLSLISLIILCRYRIKQKRKNLNFKKKIIPYLFFRGGEWKKK